MVKVAKNSCSMKSKPLGRGALPSRCGSTQNTSANIRVVVRVRPANQRESEQNHRNVIDVVDAQMLVFDPKEEQLPFYHQGIQQPNRNFLKRPNKEMAFVFDHVCSQDATNQDVFETTTKDILVSLMDGYNCSVFVYGATGAGKTFTMIGSMENPGITYLTMEHLFYSINSFEKDREFDIAVSYIEVYNENVFDLLKPSKTPLQLREDSKYGVRIAGITIYKIKTAQQLLDLLENGNKNRTQHPTDANAESSRSHAVFQVYISMRNRTSGQVRTVKLSMIDLAGSERASATGCSGDRFKEGANINRSLLSLGNCINKLADGSGYIPYRDSKLTRLLKDSLGGNCKTVMIANVSPSSLCFEDTYNTLKYAARANKIQQSVSRNIHDGDMRTSQYVKLCEELTNKVKELEAKLALSSLQPPAPPAPTHDIGKEKACREWRDRIEAESRAHSSLESRLLGLMTRQRVLALRHRLRTRAFTHIMELAHRSSTDGIQQICTEDIPRQERMAESYMKQSVALDSEIMSAWTNWSTSRHQLDQLCGQAVLDCPSLQDFVQLVKLQSENRQFRASDELKHKLLMIENDEIDAFSVYTIDMPGMLKKLYLTLKGYGKVLPALTDEYLGIVKKAKSAKGISWSDESATEVTDSHFKFITTLELDKPSRIPCLSPPSKSVLNVTTDIVTDSDDLTDQDQENKGLILSAMKRKGTPIKLANNETIVIDDSFEALDTTRTMNSAKKVKREIGQIAPDVENYAVIDAEDLNSTFVLAGKFESMRKLPVKQQLALPVKQELAPPVKRGLVDRTNVQRNIGFNDNKPKMAKPVVGKAFPFRRPAVTGAVGPAAPRAPGFGSSLSRDGTPLTRNIQVSGSRSNTGVTERSVGFKAVRARERMQTHPYSRPSAFNRR